MTAPETGLEAPEWPAKERKSKMSRTLKALIAGHDENLLAIGAPIANGSLMAVYAIWRPVFAAR